MSTPSGTKICPDCAEEVKSQARICRHCRFEFDSDSTSDTEGMQKTGEESAPDFQAAKLYAEHGANSAVFALMGYEVNDAERAYEHHRAAIALLGMNASRKTLLSQRAKSVEGQQAASIRPHNAAKSVRIVRTVRATVQEPRKTPAELHREALRKEELARRQKLAEKPAKQGFAARAWNATVNVAGAVLEEMCSQSAPREEKPLSGWEKAGLEMQIRSSLQGAEYARRSGHSAANYEASAAIAAAKLTNGRK